MKFDNFLAVDEGFQSFDGRYANISGASTTTMMQTSITNSITNVQQSGWVSYAYFNYPIPHPQYPNRKLVVIAQINNVNAMAFQNATRLIPTQNNSFIFNLGKTGLLNFLTNPALNTNVANFASTFASNGFTTTQAVNNFLSYLSSQTELRRNVYVPYLNQTFTIPANIFRYACYYQLT